MYAFFLPSDSSWDQLFGILGTAMRHCDLIVDEDDLVSNLTSIFVFSNHFSNAHSWSPNSAKPFAATKGRSNVSAPESVFANGWAPMPQSMSAGWLQFVHGKFGSLLSIRTSKHHLTGRLTKKNMTYKSSHSWLYRSHRPQVGESACDLCRRTARWCIWNAWIFIHGQTRPDPIIHVHTCRVVWHQSSPFFWSWPKFQSIPSLRHTEKFENQNLWSCWAHSDGTWAGCDRACEAIRFWWQLGTGHLHSGPKHV